MQSRTESLIETVVGTVIGYVVALCAQMIIFPLYGIEASMSVNLWITFWFTLVSVVRGYIIRRWFNKRLRTMAEKMARMVE